MRPARDLVLEVAEDRRFGARAVRWLGQFYHPLVLYEVRAGQS